MPLTPEQQKRVDSLRPEALRAAKSLANRQSFDDLHSEAELILCEAVLEGVADRFIFHRIRSRLITYRGRSARNRGIETPADSIPARRELPNQCAVDALETLGDDEKAVLQLYAEGYTVDEVAELRRVSRKTVDRTLTRIRERLSADPNSRRFLATLRPDLRRTKAEREGEDSTAKRRRSPKATYKHIGGVWVIRSDSGCFAASGGWSHTWETATHYISAEDCRPVLKRLAEEGFDCKAEFIDKKMVRDISAERKRQQRKGALTAIADAMSSAKAESGGNLDWLLK